MDALPARGPYEAKITVRLWDGTIYRTTIRAKSKGEFRRIANEKRNLKLNSTSTRWDKGKKIGDFINEVSKPAIAAARLRPNTLKRYELTLKHITDQLGDKTINEAEQLRTLERVLQTIGKTHGRESARQARTVLSKYVLNQLVREGVIDHNRLNNFSIDLGDVRKGSKPRGGQALSDAQYDAVVDHLIGRDTSAPIPPGTDRRYTSIVKHDNTVALTLLQAGTGLRISEALALTKADVVTHEDTIAVTVSPEVSKTHRGRTVPILDERIADYWRARLTGLRQADPLIPAPGNRGKRWRTDNAVKATAALYKDVGKVLDDPTVAAMRSHSWRTILNTKAMARGVSMAVRTAYFGHTEAMNLSNYTDLTDVGSMVQALKSHKGTS